MKLFLYSSYLISSEHCQVLCQLTGKAPDEITFAAIDNAADVFPDSETWVGESRDALKSQGSQVEVVDLRSWRDKRVGLHEKLASKDVIWLCGGHGYYLRWLLRESGADNIIKTLVRQGKVYAGWSAGAVMAGPSLQYFDIFDDPKDAPEMIWDGLGLTDIVVIPHMDLKEFEEGMKKINEQFKQDGFATAPLREDQALLINGTEQRVI